MPNPPRIKIFALALIAAGGFICGYRSIPRTDDSPTGGGRKPQPTLTALTAGDSKLAPENRQALGDALQSFAAALEPDETGARDFRTAWDKTSQFREPHRTTMRDWLLAEWAAHDIEAALDFAGARREIRHAILAAHARSDPEGALGIALRDATDHNGEAELVLETFSEIDPSGAFELAQSYGIDPNQEMAANWIAQDPFTALPAIDALLVESPAAIHPSDPYQITQRWPREKLLEGARWLAAWQPQSTRLPSDQMQLNLLLKLHESDPSNAFEVGTEIDLPWKHRQHLLRAWAKDDPENALAWFAAAHESLPPEAGVLALAQLASHLDSRHLHALVERMTPADRRRILRNSIENRAGTLGELLDHAGRFPDEINPGNFEYSSWWDEKTARLSAQELEELAAGRSAPIQNRLRRRANRTAAKEDPRAAADRFSNTARPDGAITSPVESLQRQELANEIASEWMGQDPEGFASWLAAHPQSELHQPAVALTYRMFTPQFAESIRAAIKLESEEVTP